MNQAQHIWLAIMTELAIERCSRFSAALQRNYAKHLLGGEVLHKLFW